MTRALNLTNYPGTHAACIDDHRQNYGIRLAGRGGRHLPGRKEPRIVGVHYAPRLIKSRAAHESDFLAVALCGFSRK